jgi:hypothetical protein
MLDNMISYYKKIPPGSCWFGMRKPFFIFLFINWDKKTNGESLVQHQTQDSSQNCTDKIQIFLLTKDKYYYLPYNNIPLTCTRNACNYWSLSCIIPWKRIFFLIQRLERAPAYLTLTPKGKKHHWVRLRWQDATSYILWHFSTLEIML